LNDDAVDLIPLEVKYVACTSFCFFGVGSFAFVKLDPDPEGHDYAEENESRFRFHSNYSLGAPLPPDGEANDRWNERHKN
jgi:hypothetical protein